MLSSYRRTDERIARAFGKAHPGRLCTLDNRISLDESPAIFAEALMQVPLLPLPRLPPPPPPPPLSLLALALLLRQPLPLLLPMCLL